MTCTVQHIRALKVIIKVYENLLFSSWSFSSRAIMGDQTVMLKEKNVRNPIGSRSSKGS